MAFATPKLDQKPRGRFGFDMQDRDFARLQAAGDGKNTPFPDKPLVVASTPTLSASQPGALGRLGEFISGITGGAVGSRALTALQPAALAPVAVPSTPITPVVPVAPAATSAPVAPVAPALGATTTAPAGTGVFVGGRQLGRDNTGRLMVDPDGRHTEAGDNRQWTAIDNGPAAGVPQGIATNIMVKTGDNIRSADPRVAMAIADRPAPGDRPNRFGDFVPVHTAASDAFRAKYFNSGERLPTVTNKQAGLMRLQDRDIASRERMAEVPVRVAEQNRLGEEAKWGVVTAEKRADRQAQSEDRRFAAETAADAKRDTATIMANRPEQSNQYNATSQTSLNDDIKRYIQLKKNPSKVGFFGGGKDVVNAEQAEISGLEAALKRSGIDTTQLLNEQDQADPSQAVEPRNAGALEWLKKNPNDPRAAAVKKKLGIN